MNQSRHSSTAGSKATWQVGTQPGIGATPTLMQASRALSFAEYQQKQNLASRYLYKKVKS